MKKRLIAANASTFALAAAFAWALSAPVQAQNANDQATAGAAGQGAANTPAAAAPADQSTDQNGAGALQEVVVTAERRAVNIQQTPIDITAIEGSDLQSLHVDNLDELETTVPGFQSANQQTDQINNIRGLGLTANSGSLLQGVKSIFDGIVHDATYGLEQPMYDLADVEVLEGPQGTFIGSSAIAGAVEQNSNNPNFNGFGGYALAGAGNYLTLKFQGALNLPVSDTFALRWAFDVDQRNSFSEDIGDTLGGFYYTSYSTTNPASDGPPKGLQQGSVGSGAQIDPGNINYKAMRLKALWKPTDNFQSLSSIEFSSDVTDGTSQEPNPLTYTSLWTGISTTSGCTSQAASINYPGSQGVQLLCPQAGTVYHSQYYYPGEQPYVLDYYNTINMYEIFQFQWSEELRYTLPDGTVLRSLTGEWEFYNQSQMNTSNGPQDSGISYHPIGIDPFYEETVDLISPTTGPFFSKVNWVTGTYFEYRNGPVPITTTAVPSPYQPGSQPTSYSITSTGARERTGGVYGQINWQMTDTLQLQTGLRWNWDNNFASTPEWGVAPAPGTILNAPSGNGTYSILYTAAACGAITPPCYKVNNQGPNSGQYADHVWTGKEDLNWTPIPGQNFYAFFARGYAGGGVNSGSTDHPTFTQEYANDWELGWKGSLFNNHVKTQLGLYDEVIQNFAYTVEDLNVNNDTSIGSYVANFPSSTIKGVSFAEQARFGGLGIDGSLDYNKTALGNVQTLNNSQLPANFGSPNPYPQCLPSHNYTLLASGGCFNYTPYLANVSGGEFPDAPLFQLNLAVDYLFHVGAGTVDPRVTYGFTSHQYQSIYDNTYQEMTARHLWGATIDWVEGHFDTQVYGLNLTNELYVDSNAGSSVFYGAPRQLGFQEKYSF